MYQHIGQANFAVASLYLRFRAPALVFISVGSPFFLNGIFRCIYFPKAYLNFLTERIEPEQLPNREREVLQAASPFSRARLYLG